MLQVYLTGPNGYPPCHTLMQHMGEGKEGDAQEVRESKGGKAKDNQIAYELAEDNAGSASLHSGYVSRYEKPEMGAGHG